VDYFDDVSFGGGRLDHMIRLVIPAHIVVPRVLKMIRCTSQNDPKDVADCFAFSVVASVLCVIVLVLIIHSMISFKGTRSLSVRSTEYIFLYRFELCVVTPKVSPSLFNAIAAMYS
jgi:hypothetical protein